ncbi:MAG: leucine-rich repeat protein [Clostridiales bacterium]|nr:leucine-rich repeat protein [Clostridiales bacterium]
MRRIAKTSLSFLLITAFALLFLPQTATVASDPIVVMDHSRTKADIIAMAKAHPHSGFDEDKVTSYAVPPVLTAPHAAGSLAAADITDALNTMIMIRYIAGLPYDITFPTELNNIAQHGAVLLAATDQFTHEPVQKDGVSKSFFDLGYKGCYEANLSYGRSNISNTIIAFSRDGDDNNIENTGHRRWVLSPHLNAFGIGFAATGKSAGDNYISLHTPHQDPATGVPTKMPDTYIAWPGAGDFPIQYFIGGTDLAVTCPLAWSLNLGEAYAVPDRNAITLTLTRTRDKKVWVFDKTTPRLGLSPGATAPNDALMHLAVDNFYYGTNKAIIFRPDVPSLGQIQDGDIFHVKLEGIATAAGAPTSLEYNINFFDLEKPYDHMYDLLDSGTRTPVRVSYGDGINEITLPTPDAAGPYDFVGWTVEDGNFKDGQTIAPALVTSFTLEGGPEIPTVYITYMAVYAKTEGGITIYTANPTVTPVPAGYAYEVLPGGGVKITGYTGAAAFLSLPKEIEGRIVMGIDDEAFAGNTTLTRVILPAGLTQIGPEAFAGCTKLTEVIFCGDPPAEMGEDVFPTGNAGLALYYPLARKAQWDSGGTGLWQGLPAISCLWGNASLSGSIGAQDAAKILRHLVQLEVLSPYQLLLSDANADGNVTAQDAAVILRYLVQLVSKIGP